MIKHLCKKMVIMMMTSQKYHNYKTEGYRKPWDPTMSIMAYFTDCGISTSIKEKAMAAGTRMRESKMFTEDQMVAWENRPTIDQTWTNLQTYFTEKWLERRQYLAATAKQSHFKEAALAAQEQASAAEEGKTQAMMFALLQEQLQSHLETMAAANKASTEGTMERMNALITAQGGRKPPADREITPPLTNGGKEDNSKKRGARHKKAMHPHCQALMYHKPEKCYELEANKDKRWVGWKSIKKTMACQGLGTETVDSIAAKIVAKPATNHYNYWSPLACQVDEQEKPEISTHEKEKLSTISTGSRNKIAVHWAHKIANQKAQTGLLDKGATSGAGRPEDAEFFEHTGQPSIKVFMLPDKSRVRATHKMLLKHKLREGGREMNIVPGLHSTLVSVPKMVDKDYIVIFDKKSAKTYYATMTAIIATEKPVLEAPRYTSTGLWLMPLEADRTKENGSSHYGNIESDTISNIGEASERANAIFKLPSTRKTIH